MTIHWRAIGKIAIIAAAMVVLNASSALAQASCTISTTSVAFGNYNVFNATPVDGTGQVTFRCNSSAFNITITLGKGQSGTFFPRAMRKGAESLTYNLYRDAARTNIWGDGTGGTQVYSNANPPNNTNVNVSIFGRIPAGQDVSAGAYSDTVAATVNF